MDIFSSPFLGEGLEGGVEAEDRFMVEIGGAEKAESGSR
jgi:hypothetical protein